jgi:hypothetical protein
MGKVPKGLLFSKIFWQKRRKPAWSRLTNTPPANRVNNTFTILVKNRRLNGNLICRNGFSLRPKFSTPGT